MKTTQIDRSALSSRFGERGGRVWSPSGCSRPKPRTYRARLSSFCTYYKGCRPRAAERADERTTHSSLKSEHPKPSEHHMEQEHQHGGGACCGGGGHHQHAHAAEQEEEQQQQAAAQGPCLISFHGDRREGRSVLNQTHARTTPQHQQPPPPPLRQRRPLPPAVARVVGAAAATTTTTATRMGRKGKGGWTRRRRPPPAS